LCQGLLVLHFQAPAAEPRTKLDGEVYLREGKEVAQGHTVSQPQSRTASMVSRLLFPQEVKTIPDVFFLSFFMVLGMEPQGLAHVR
jgi:hypothetical protein